MDFGVLLERREGGGARVKKKVPKARRETQPTANEVLAEIYGDYHDPAFDRAKGRSKREALETRAQWRFMCKRFGVK